MARIVAIEGPSGVGKTVVAQRLAASLGVPWIPEAYVRLGRRPSLRFLGLGSLARIERRLFEEECQRYQRAAELRAGGVSPVVDTGFLGPLTYSEGLAVAVDPRWDVRARVVDEALRALRLGEWGFADVHLYLDAPQSVVTRRTLDDPIGHPEALRDRHGKVGRIEREFWRGRARRQLPGRVYIVRAGGSVEATVQRALKCLARPPPRGAVPFEAAFRLVEGFRRRSPAPRRRTKPATVKRRGRRARPPR